MALRVLCNLVGAGGWSSTRDVVKECGVLEVWLVGSVMWQSVTWYDVVKVVKDLARV